MKVVERGLSFVVSCEEGGGGTRGASDRCLRLWTAGASADFFLNHYRDVGWRGSFLTLCRKTHKKSPFLNHCRESQKKYPFRTSLDNGKKIILSEPLWIMERNPSFLGHCR